jgi:hypothetical protein
MKVSLFVVLVFMIAVTTIWGQTWKSGATTITLNGETLIVSGKGAMEDYCYDCNRPWYSSQKTITSLVIEAGVMSIGETAFGGFSGLTSVTIPSSVTTIGDNAFAYCTTLPSVTIPNSVKTIGWGAFSGCKNLTTITIPSSVMNIDERAFFQSYNLTSIDVAPDNIHYSSVDGVLFNKNKTTLLICPQGKKGAYTIPNSVTSLGKIAFKNCRNLTSITCLNAVPPNADVESLFVPSNICLYVPENSIATYRAVERWKNHFECIKNIADVPK